MGKTYAGKPIKGRKLRDWHGKLKYKYGLTPEDLASLEAKQNNCCAVCNLPAGKNWRGRLFVDHDHNTGKVRGLLCNDCNVGIGRFRDNPALLKAAAEYLA